MMYPFLTLNDQEGRLLSRQKTRGPQDKHLRDFLTPCGLHNSRFDPMLYLLDPTFPGWGHCIKIRVICQKQTSLTNRWGMFVFHRIEGFEPRALGKAPGAPCNPRRPARRRANPSFSAIKETSFVYQWAKEVSCFHRRGIV